MQGLATLIVLALAIPLLVSCSSSGVRSSKLAGDPKKVIGHLNWTITEPATGQTIGQGDRDILAGDVKVEIMPSGEMGDLTSYKVDLGNDFVVSLNSSKEDSQGFGISATRESQPSFSWEWFNVSGQTATKIQETGTLQAQFAGGKLSRIDFQTDISIRLVEMKEPLEIENPKWRILIGKGSYLAIPN